MTKTRIDHKQELVKLIKQSGYTYGVYEIFNDFLELTACTISNTVDPSHWQEREDRYIKVIKSYDKKHQQLFPQMFYHLVEALEHKTQTTGTEDVLGVIYHELELHRKEKAQYFTPQHLSDFMGMVALGDDGCKNSSPLPRYHKSAHTLRYSLYFQCRSGNLCRKST